MPEGSYHLTACLFSFMNYTKIHHELRKALNISPFHYFALDIIYNCSEQYGYCNMSRSELAEKIGVSVRSCKTYFSDLEKMGLIESKGQKNNRASDIYKELVMLAEAGKVQELHHKVQELHHLKSAKVAPKRGKGCTLQSAKVAPTLYNTKKDTKDTEEAPPEVEKEEVQHIERFGGRIAIEFQLYNLFKELDPNTHTGKATRGELNDLKSLARDIKEHLQEVKKREGFAGYAVRPDEVIQHFRDFYSRLEDSVKNTKFTCNHMKWNYADLRKKQSQKGRSNNSNSVLKQVQNIPDYKIEKRKK